MAKKKPSAAIEKASRLMEKDFKPRTKNQENCIISMAEKTITTICGPAGTGKSTLACGMASEYLCENKVDKIFITRPMVQCGKNGGGVGFLPGDVSDKFGVYALPLTAQLEYFLGKEKYRIYLQNGTIEIMPIDLSRGRSLEDTFIIVDEVQNTIEDQIDMISTRIGKGSKMVMTGDLEQTDLHPRDAGAFEEFIGDIKHLDSVGCCELDITDMQRHPVVADIIAARKAAKEKRNK